MSILHFNCLSIIVFQKYFKAGNHLLLIQLISFWGALEFYGSRIVIIISFVLKMNIISRFGIFGIIQTRLD